jgi:hypothetical protein
MPSSIFKPFRLICILICTHTIFYLFYAIIYPFITHDPFELSLYIYVLLWVLSGLVVIILLFHPHSVYIATYSLCSVNILGLLLHRI